MKKNYYLLVVLLTSFIGFSQITNTTYRGAFGATDWTDGWAEFNPITKAY